MFMCIEDKKELFWYLSLNDTVFENDCSFVKLIIFAQAVRNFKKGISPSALKSPPTYAGDMLVPSH